MTTPDTSRDWDTHPNLDAAADGVQVIPLAEETLVVKKRRVVTGRVRVRKIVTERDETFDEPLIHTRTEVTRVPIGRIVADAPAPRREGASWIIPVVEEVLVVERRLRLVEELHVTEVREEHRAPQTVRLRREEVIVEELDGEELQ